MRLLVAGRVRTLRAQSKKTMSALCSSVGMSRAFWTDIEKGKRNISIETLEHLAHALGVDILDLLAGHKAAKRKGRDRNGNGNGRP